MVCTRFLLSLKPLFGLKGRLLAMAKAVLCRHVDANGRVKVCAVNLAKVGASMDDTYIHGNPRWLAPEVLSGATASTASVRYEGVL